MQDFKEQFDQQVAFLNSSAKAYDAGEEAEAKRLAVTLRVLLHDTRNSVSLLKHLGIKGQLSFVNTVVPDLLPGAIVVFDGGLCSARKTLGQGAGTRFVPPLGGDPLRNRQPRQCFEDWWEKPVLHDQEENEFSRKSLVRAVADQDGGAHVDAQLETAYAALTRGNSMRMTTERGTTEDGWEVVMGGTFGGPGVSVEPPTHGDAIENSIALASIRQIAFEVLTGLAGVAWDDSGHATVPDPICQLALLKTDVSALLSATGRNDECPCGSGRKFKRCFLKKHAPKPRLP
jgi:hypothetical protein